MLCAILLQKLVSEILVLILQIVGLMQPGHFQGHTYDIISAFQVCTGMYIDPPPHSPSLLLINLLSSNIFIYFLFIHCVGGVCSAC